MAIRSRKESIFFVMFRDFAASLTGMGEDFAAIINDYSNVERTIAAMKMAESECDSKCHDILQELNESFVTPFDREDIFAIANQMDDLADYMEDIASKFTIYEIKALRGDAVEMGNIIADATKQVKILFDELPHPKKNEEAKAAIVEINRLENIGDAVFRRALNKLFKEEKDPVEIIKWKDLYEGLEDALDACEHLADTVKGVMVKNA
ncbi:MAG: DUF47 family protein [Eubacteriales bacterium]|nr:DUF47 family protein [Eubacteriales bacterium]